MNRYKGSYRYPRAPAGYGRRGSGGWPGRSGGTGRRPGPRYGRGGGSGRGGGYGGGYGRRRQLPVAWLVGSSLAALALIAGLVALARPQPPKPVDGPGGAVAADDVLVLATGTATESRPALPDEGWKLLHDRALASGPGGRGPAAVVLGVDGDGTTQRQVVDLTPRRGNRPDGDIEHIGSHRETAVRAAVERVDGLVGSVAATRPGHALFAGLLAAGQLPARTIIICSSGLDTALPVDLRTLGFDYPPEDLVGYLKRIDALPRLGGKHVLLALAGTAGAQQEPTEPVRRELAKLWTAVLTAAGATVTPVAPPTARPPVTQVATPTVPIPRLQPPPRRPSRPGPVRVVLPSAVTFRSNSAELLDPAGAATAVAQIARLVVGRSTVSIVGHTAHDQDDADRGVPLSRDRARVIEQLLRRAGVPAGAITAVTGVGSAEPLYQPDTDARNRAVVVTVMYRP